MQLVPIISIEEVELALISMRVAWKTEELKNLQAQLSPLELALADFEERVAQQCGSLISERDRLRQKCSELDAFTTRLHARLAADPDGIMNEVFSPDELRRIGELCNVQVPDDWFFEESHATTPGRGWSSFEDVPEESPVTSANVAKAAESADLRTLYRQLARTFHPDLTANTQERDFCQEVMLRINHAWHLRDLRAMQIIAEDLQDLVAGRLRSISAYRMAWYRRELTRLEDECLRHLNRLSTLRSSKTITLWQNKALANVAIARHLARLQHDIADLQVRQAAMLDEFRQALGTYAASR